MKTIKLPAFDIEISLEENGGSIESSLHEPCEECGKYDCLHEDSPYEYNIAMDTIESFLLALAVAGIDVESPAVLEALETAVNAAANHY